MNKKITNSEKIRGHVRKINALLQFLKNKRDKLGDQKQWPEEIGKRTKDNQTVKSSSISNYKKTGKEETYLLIFEGMDSYMKEFYPGYIYDGKGEYLPKGLKQQDKIEKQVVPITDPTVSSTFKTLSSFAGLYVGYFIRPRGIQETTEPEEKISKLTLLLCPDYEAYARSTHSESAKLKKNKLKYHYIGQWKIVHNSIHVNFSNTADTLKYEFLLAFDIETRREEFNKYLKGIYAGTAVIKKPNAGRMILHQEKKWRSIKSGLSKREIVKWYLSSKETKPSELRDKEAIDLLNNEVYLQFFTKDTRYTENISIIEKYTIDTVAFLNLYGSYSVYFITDDAKYIRRALCKITKLGKVHLNGSYESRDVRVFTQYEGDGKIIDTDNLYIDLLDIKEKKDNVFYILKIGSTPGKNKYFNGIRLRSFSEEDEHKPIATRIVFYRENNKELYKPTKAFDKISLFPISEEESQELRQFEQAHPELKQFLMGVENNIIKTFSFKRRFKREIDYAETFSVMAKHYAGKGDFDKTMRNLKYATLHGYQFSNEELRGHPFSEFSSDKRMQIQERKFIDDNLN